MKVKVSAEQCTGHGRCWTVAPDVFDADDEGFNKDRGGVVEVPAGQEKVAENAIASCPEGALEVVED